MAEKIKKMKFWIWFKFILYTIFFLGLAGFFLDGVFKGCYEAIIGVLACLIWIYGGYCFFYSELCEFNCKRQKEEDI